MKTLLKILFVLILIVVVAAAGGSFYFSTLLQPANPSNTTKQNFIVPKGQSISTIGRRLQDAGLIKSAIAFRFEVWQKDEAPKIQAGTFSLAPSMTYDQLFQAMTTGTNDVWITIPEGWRVEEVADSLDKAQLDAFKKDEFLQLAKNQEGYLFPDTYLVPRAATATAIFHLMRDNFDKKVTNGLASDIQASGKSLDDIVTLASLVQREARQAQTMKMVAGILDNRLQLGMALDVDATLQYIRGYNPIVQSWWDEPLADTKDSKSLYNTYKYPGLPPHPIDSPGLDAITAVLHPTPSDYLFYVTDRQGVMHYAKTLAEHNVFVQKYLR